ncbi:MAG: pilus assembly protein N-terminal domain-containing protein [Acidobacteriaceae bacterium]
MRPKICTTILCFSALVLTIGAGTTVRGQASPARARQQAATPTSQDTTNDLYVSVGKTVLVDTVEPITRVTVGVGDVAEAQATSPTEILVNGKSPGETTLIVWEQGGARQFFNVTVRPSSYMTTDALDGLRRQLRLELPKQKLRISFENGLIFLRGTVKDLNSSDRAVEIASTAGKVVNLLYIDVPPSEPQILLKVRFASVDRTLEKQLGINVFSTGAGNQIGTVSTGQFSPPTVTATPGSAPVANIPNPLNFFVFSPNINLGATLEALETKGIVEVLAQPNLLASNGKEASFLAGGEYPYPVVQGTTGGGVGAVTIQFQEFGVRLNFIPTITPRNTIRLQVAPEVSSLDYANGITISGFTVPGLDTRKVNTEVELRDGQSFAIGGLLDNRDTETFDKVPFLGDIPIIGKFFQSISRTRTNTELIVIVTPEIVAPIPAGVPLPELHYPTPFLKPNSKVSMSNPGPEVTGAKPMPPSPPRIPIEKLMDSMKPETPLLIQSGTGGAGGGQGSRGSGGGGTMPQ